MGLHALSPPAASSPLVPAGHPGAPGRVCTRRVCLQLPVCPRVPLRGPRVLIGYDLILLGMCKEPLSK